MSVAPTVKAAPAPEPTPPKPKGMVTIVISEDPAVVPNITFSGNITQREVLALDHAIRLQFRKYLIERKESE